MRKIKIAVLVSGSGSNLQVIIDATITGKINGEVTLIISNRKDAYAFVRAKKHNIPAVYIGRGNFPDKAERDKALLDKLVNSGADLVVLAGYLDIVNEELVNEFNNRIINVHPSLIPKYCGEGYYGMHVHNAVIENRESISGATVHFVDKGVDTGKIIIQQSVEVSSDDTPEILAKKVLKIEHTILVDAINKFCEDNIGGML